MADELTMCDECGAMVPFPERFILYTWRNGGLEQTSWLCYRHGLEFGGVPPRASRMIHEIVRTAAAASTNP